MSQQEYMPFEYDSETERKPRKPLTKNQHLYGDDWSEDSADRDDDDLRVDAKLPSKSKFVVEEIITQPDVVPKA